MPDAAAPPVCPRHPDRVSYVNCQRCGRPVCPECQRPAPVGIQCVDCVREAAERRGPVVNALGFQNAQGMPVVTYALIAINVGAFLWGYVLTSAARWWINWALFPGFSDQFFGTGQEPYRWITSGFVHFGWVHLLMNMFVLWQFGTQMEPVIGRLRFGILYFVSLLGGSLAIVLLSNSGADGVPHGGASGAIFGLIAAWAVVLLKLKLPAQALIASAGIWLVLGFFIGGVSWQGHVGGIVGGALTMLLMLRGVEKRQAKRNQRITPV